MTHLRESPVVGSIGTAVKTAAPAGKASTPLGKTPKKILIIDDSASIRQQVSTVLSRAGYHVLEAVDGMDGADQIRAQTDLSLVICDVNMPKLNGLDMLDSIKDEIVTRSLPVVMLTTEGQPQAIARAKKSGARAWIVKPFKEELLVGAVEKLTQRKA